MAGFHHGDPYFPNQGNVGWLEAEPEDDHPIPLDDHHVEGFPIVLTRSQKSTTYPQLLKTQT